MDLRTVLADGTDGLGSSPLERYFRDIFALYCPPLPYEGAFRVRAALNVGVQQLATRSRMNRAGERYLQVGGFDAWDLPAALIEAMAHTDVNWVSAGADRGATEAALAALRGRLAADAMPEIVRVDEADPPVACFGLIAVFSERPVDLAPFVPLLNPAGRIVVVQRDAGGVAMSVAHG